MRAPLFALLFALSATAAAQSTAQTAVTPAGVPIVRVELSTFDFTPATIRLRAGQPVILRLFNRGDRDHNFQAPLFFLQATNLSGPVRNGKVEVPGGQTIDVRLTPRRGTFRLKCGHTMHATMGMEGDIVVQ